MQRLLTRLKTLLSAKIAHEAGDEKKVEPLLFSHFNDVDASL